MAEHSRESARCGEIESRSVHLANERIGEAVVKAEGRLERIVTLPLAATHHDPKRLPRPSQKTLISRPQARPLRFTIKRRPSHLLKHPLGNVIRSGRLCRRLVHSGSAVELTKPVAFFHANTDEGRRLKIFKTNLQARGTIPITLYTTAHPLPPSTTTPSP